jgi:hypothetical protein
MSLREDYPDEADPEEACRRNYLAWKRLSEFEKLRPKKLDGYQSQLLSLFYKCRRYAEEMKPIPRRIVQELSDCGLCDSDIAEFIINGLDSEFLSICSAKVKRDIDSLKSKGNKT